MKICTKCGESKGLEAFARDKGRRDGRFPQCKVCVSEYGRKWREANREAISTRRRERREGSQREKILEQKRASWARHKDAISERRRARRAEDPEAERERDRARYERDRAKRIANVARWVVENPEKAASIQRRRRARRRSVPSEAYTREQVWRKSGGVCGICQVAIVEEAWHIDHIMPLCKGGPDTLANVQAAHARCNLSKGGRVA